MSQSATDRQTIEDFGKQWTRFPENSGWHSSQDCFSDHFGPLMSTAEFEGTRAADIGSGSGRIVQMLLDAGCAKVYAIEPSQSFGVLETVFASERERVSLINDVGEAVGRLHDLDFVISFGVLHHIVDPAPVVAAAFKALRPGGRLAIWLYGHEGNEVYIRASGALRTITKRLPDGALAALASTLDVALRCYIWLCRFLPLPMRGYMLNHLAKVDDRVRKVTIFDQLNPAYAKYYRENEARSLVAAAGFADVQLYHRHGYSWTIVGTKPATSA